MRRFVAIVALSVAFVTPYLTKAADVTSSGEARVYVEDFSEQMLSALRAPNVPKGQRADAVGRLLLETVDFPVVAKSTLGRMWRRLNERERREFTGLFAAHVIQKAVTHLNEQKAIGFVIGESKFLPNGDVRVSCQITRSDGEPIGLDWQIRKVNGRLRVVDVYLDGYLLSIHFRGEFERRAHGNVQRLFDIVRQGTKGSRVYDLLVQEAFAA